MLGYASRHTTAIEVNGTYDSTMKPESIKKWHDEAPDDFEVFLARLPTREGSRALRHVMDVRHPVFILPECRNLAKQYKVTTVSTDSDKFLHSKSQKANSSTRGS